MKKTNTTEIKATPRTPEAPKLKPADRDKHASDKSFIDSVLDVLTAPGVHHDDLNEGTIHSLLHEVRQRLESMHGYIESLESAQ